MAKHNATCVHNSAESACRQITEVTSVCHYDMLPRHDDAAKQQRCQCQPRTPTTYLYADGSRSGNCYGINTTIDMGMIQAV
jgi:hypothetical protein